MSVIALNCPSSERNAAYARPILSISGAICASEVVDEPARLDASVEADDTRLSETGVGVGVGEGVGLGDGVGVGLGVEVGVGVAVGEGVGDGVGVGLGEGVGVG